jgi:hypothetical protein
VSNDLMPLEEQTERAMEALGERLTAAGDARGDAERLESKLKSLRAVLFIKHKIDKRSDKLAEALAMADPEYREAQAEWELANIRYRRLDAEADAARLRFEAWRTASSNRRAEMNLR